jgi:protein TonB
MHRLLSIIGILAVAGAVTLSLFMGLGALTSQQERGEPVDPNTRPHRELEVERDPCARLGAICDIPPPSIEPLGQEQCRDPRPISRIEPTYPREALERGLEGDVLVELDTDEGGYVVNPRVISSTDPVFEQPTLRAVSRWRYQSCDHNGHPRALKNIRVTIEFRLNDYDAEEETYP